MNPEEDGVTHINTYSRGNTELGRWLSNWAYAPFTHLIYGDFKSIEGFWYWLGARNSTLKDLHGYSAKELGQALPRKYIMPDDDFRKEIKYALHKKLSSDPFMADMLKNSVLPLTHYYNYNGKIIIPFQFGWMTEWWTEARKKLKG